MPVSRLRGLKALPRRVPGPRCTATVSKLDGRTLFRNEPEDLVFGGRIPGAPGHPARRVNGPDDDVLREIVQLSIELFRGQDVVGRHRGEESTQLPDR
jgi:hypothetical protein